MHAVKLNDSDSRPRLSIVTATWQAASTLERCLDATIAQEFEDWEIVIADGASTDGTVDILRAYDSHIAWWDSAKDAGIYDAWNKALPHTRGDYICFLGADDAWADRQALSRLFDAIGSNDYDLVTSVSAALTSIGNVGPGLGAIGPTATFLHLPAHVKLVLVASMLAGRLEIFTLLVLFQRRFWNR